MTEFDGYNNKPVQATVETINLKMQAFSLLGKTAAFFAAVAVLKLLFEG